MDNAERKANYQRANGRDELTRAQAKRINLKRGREQARNARRIWRRKR